MQNLVTKWRETGSVENKTSNYPKRVRTPENIARVQESLEQSPTKSQRRLSVQVGIKRTSCRNIIEKNLRLYPYKFTVVHALERPDEPSRVELCWLFLSKVESELLDPQFFISSDESWFSLSGRNRYTSGTITAIAITLTSTACTPYLPLLLCCTQSVTRGSPLR
ncbi:hypothetical protein ANN_11149 [Periplaneta americana]|uniref:Uncharacterized protein n=1 Tax=Periplaneta americana TaxID=6978 RepID=A0ABQ8T476_PERAM|nr:hypothetical protein ANN_11149 [Periplaneta americana]